MAFTAVVRITGAGRLSDFRERLRWLLVRDPDAEDYTEHHAGAMLEYRFTPRKGLPFPALTEASGNFPELRVEAEWQHDGVRGRAVRRTVRSNEIAVELVELVPTFRAAELAYEPRRAFGIEQVLPDAVLRECSRQ